MVKSDGWQIPVAFGVVASAFIGPFLWKIFGGIVFDVRHPLAVRIFFALFCLPFAAFGLGFLFCPLWHWLLTRGSVWAITDRRVIRFFGPFVKTWWRVKMFDRVVTAFLSENPEMEFTMCVYGARPNEAMITRNLYAQAFHKALRQRALT